MKCKIPNRDTLIDSYILKILSNNEIDEETEKFEEHFFSCNNCFNEVKLRTELVSLIRDEGKAVFRKPEYKSSMVKIIKATIDKLIDLISQQPVWIRAFAIILIVLLVGRGSFLVVDTLTKDPFSEYVYGNKVPYAFDPSEKTRLRGASSTLEDATLIQSFNNTFITGMLEYRDHNYKRSIEILTKLQTTAAEFQEKSTDPEILTLLRDYHFYLGVSHLAISTSQQINVNERTKQLYLEDAIQELSRSTTLAITNTLNLIDRDRFFLGLSYGLAGKWELAVEELNKIDSSSLYSGESSELVAKLARIKDK